MIIGTLLRLSGYLLSLGTSIVIFLLALEWLVHYLPGAGANPIRRAIFQVTFPVLRFGDRYFPLTLGHLNVRGLLVAAVLWILLKGLLPWLVWAGFVLKG